MTLDRQMNWDPGLLRKFSSTGHFRLLNQLRSDLKKRPLDRDAFTGSVKMPGRGARQAAVKPNPVYQPQATSRSELSAPIKNNPLTFRERLSAIEMR